MKPEKKKIIMIRNAYSYDFGGGERVPVNVVSELKKHGYEGLIISRSPKLLEFAVASNIRIIRGIWWSRQDWSGISMVLLPIYSAWMLFVLLWYLMVFAKERPSIVHIGSRDDFIAATLAAKALRVPVYWSDYADLKYIYQNHTVWYKNPIGKAVYWCSKLARAVLLTSKSDKSLIEKAIDKKLPERYIVMYYGVFDRPDLLNKKHVGERVIFAATSRLVTAKGIGELIQAFKRLNTEMPKTELWLFGEGPEEAKFKAMAEGNENIIFQGFPGDALEQVEKADIFVHPSYMEGFSISLVEAAMLGKPIIACTVGGNPELVNEHNGILIKPRDSDALYRAMHKLAENSELRSNLGRGARATYEEHLNFEDIIKKRFIPLYEK